jgi:hypothetical protein
MLPGDVRRARQAMLAWRTMGRGGPVQSCPEGLSEWMWYHVCQQRRCPPGAWLPIESGLVPQQARGCACEPTLPCSLGPVHGLSCGWPTSPRERSARRPGQAWPGTSQGHDGGLERTRSSPPHRPFEARSGGRRVDGASCQASKVAGRAPGWRW